MTPDEKYVRLMEKYKLERRKDPQGAVKYLDAAMKLREKGKVSDDATLGGAYI